ncbi:MAG: hypothetical protein ABIF10_03965 [Candidatus Woesearchaeota archaeon]
MIPRSRAALVIGLAAFFVLATLFSATLDGFPQITGRAVTQLSIIQKYKKTCNFTMTQGLNLVCIPCLRAGTPTEEAVQQIWDTSSQCPSAVISVHSYKSEDGLDHWKSYNQCLPKYVIQDLTVMEDNEAYFVNMRIGRYVNFTNDITIPNYITLYQGWNMAGYAANDTNKPRSIATAFPDISGSVIEIQSYCNGTYQVHNSTQTDFNILQPFRGYWIKMQENRTWVIDW